MDDDKKDKLIRFANTCDIRFLEILKEDLIDVLKTTSYNDALIWLWQQNAGQCYNLFINTYLWFDFMSMFKVNTESSLYYRGVNLDIVSYKEDRLILSASKDYTVAKNFAKFRSNSGNYSRSDKGFVLTLTADAIIDLEKEGYGIVDNEQEVLLLNWHIIGQPEIC